MSAQPVSQMPLMIQQTNLKQYLQVHLKANGFDRHSKYTRNMVEELQKLMIKYQEEGHSLDEYTYVFYDFGINLSAEQQQAIKKCVKEVLEGEECIGSINNYSGRIDGLLYLHKEVVPMFHQAIQDQGMQMIMSEVTENPEFRVHDKWGRAESFLLF